MTRKTISMAAIFIMFLSLSSLKALAEECIFGYSYYNPSENKVIIPCIMYGDSCFYGELRITPDGDIVLDDLMDTGIEPPLTYESDILAQYMADLNKLVIPELRIGGPFGIDDGPFNVTLIPYLEDEQIKFEVDKIEYTMATNICEDVAKKAALMVITMPDDFTLPYCLEFVGPSSFRNAWVNHFKQMGASTSFLDVTIQDSCPKAAYSCLYYVDESDPNNYGYMYLYWYDTSTLSQVNSLCSAMAVSGAGAGPLVFNDSVVGSLLNLYLNPVSQ